jgi:hypothetical protein
MLPDLAIVCGHDRSLVCGCVGLDFGLDRRWPRILPCVTISDDGRGFAMGVLTGTFSKDWFLGQ